MENIYVVRKFVYVEGGSKHIYEERVFDTHNGALEFVKNISFEDDDRFLSEIISYVINDMSCDYAEDRCIYDKNGELIWTSKSDVQANADAAFSGKFFVGDIVELQPFPYNHASPTVVRTIGVVSRVPISLDKWIVDGNEKQYWDNMYVIDYIRDGYLGHWHAEECAINYYNYIVPDDIYFIKLLSEHYLKKTTLPDAVIEDAYKGNLYIQRVKHIDSALFTGGGHGESVK